MSLALQTLIFEWRRYLAAIVALAFSGLLVLAQIGMFIGIGQAFTATIDRSPADIIILKPKAENLFGSGGMPSRLKPLVFMHPAVTQVSDMDGDGGLFQNRPIGDGEKKREWVQIMSVDTQKGAVTLPTDFGEDVRNALSEPYAIAMDRSTLPRLGVKLGDKATLDGRTVKIAAVLTTYPNMMQPMIMMSRDTLRLLGKTYRSDRIGPMMVRIADPSQAERVRDELNVIGKGQYRAWTRQELAAENEKMIMKEQFIGVMLGFSLFLGLLIGIGITSQTLRGAILANVKEFASLRALGVGMGSLRVVVLELSFWVGLAGLGATALLVAGVAVLAGLGGVPMGFPLFYVVGTGAFLLIIAMLSGMMALGVLKQSQPADLLR